ncbi:MAG: glycosyltransferase family 4 protein [Bacteroidales bacterium]
MNQQKLKVLFISSWFPNKQNSTLGNFVEKHAEAVSLYADVSVLHVCFHSAYDAKKEYVIERCENLDIHIIYLKKIKTNIPIFTAFLKFCKIITAYHYGFKQIYKNSKPAIIHANILIPIGLIAYYFKFTKKIPYIITEHWTGYLPQDANKPNSSIFFYRYFAKKAAALTPVTQNLALAMQDFKIIGNYNVIPNVVEINLFKQKQNINSEVKRIIHVSSLEEDQKNFKGILFAISELNKLRKDFLLEVISDGDFEQYQNNIEILGITDKIIFHGKKNTVEVAAIMQHCDFLLLFSNYENFPCVIAEAMSCGLPVLSTKVGGIAEHINGDNGILIEAHNLKMFISELNRMIDICRTYNSSQIRFYAENHFSYEVIGKQYFEIYKSVLN